GSPGLCLRSRPALRCAWTERICRPAKSDRLRHDLCSNSHGHAQAVSLSLRVPGQSRLLSPADSDSYVRGAEPHLGMAACQLSIRAILFSYYIASSRNWRVVF